jgi:hypothetical protein
MSAHRLIPAAFALLFGLPGFGAALAQQGPVVPPRRLEIWDIKLGTAAAALPDEFVDYACGTNGGPPSLPLGGFADFKRCRPEPSGLREVYFRYDDELEYWARANNVLAQFEQVAGTKTYGFPIVASVLFDDAGAVAGIRLVSDPRDDSQDRDDAYLLKNFLTARFGRDGWACQDLAPDLGETPVDGVFVKQDCRKTLGDRTLSGQDTASLSVRYLRKPGQTRLDPHSGKQTRGLFESTVHFEIVRQK